ncbi:MAG: glycoside hydrolase family 28 protein [Lentimicrobiaceae bacterium]|jgi:polygalacturonase
MKNRLLSLNKIFTFLSLLIAVIPNSNRAFGQTDTTMPSLLTGLPFQMPIPTLPVFPDNQVNILNFGANGNGLILNTEAFNKAIEACVVQGGGRVIVPAGVWLTGPIQFKSNIDLHLEKGALIIFSKDHNDYPIIQNPVNKSYMVASPIYGFSLENIAITGDGIIDGSGETWRPVKKSKTTEAQWKKLISSGGVVSGDKSMYWPTKEAMEGEKLLADIKKLGKKASAEDYLPARDFMRPYMVVFYQCKKVLLDGPTFQNSPKFVLYPTFCEDMTIRNINVLNEWWYQNGDGIDINGGKNILVYNCTVSAGDDGICMKSSKSSNYKQDPALQNVVIANCVVYHGHGGFVIGSNTDGGMKNISVSNCNFIGTDIGLRFKSSRKKGGLVENIFINNIYMKDIVNEAILFDTYYETSGNQGQIPQPVNEMTPRFQKFNISNIYCVGAGQAVTITGLPEMPIQDIELNNITISAENGFTSTDAQNIRLNKVNILPVKGTVYTLNNSKDFIMQSLECPTNAVLFIKLEGKNTANIQLINTDLSKAQKGTELGKEVDTNALIQK